MKESITLIDHFRQFHEVSTTKLYAPSVRCLYFTLLGIWNEKKRPNSFVVVHAAVRALSGLEESTYKAAFNFLASSGWLKARRCAKKGIASVSLAVPCGNGDSSHAHDSRELETRGANAEVKKGEQEPAKPARVDYSKVAEFLSKLERSDIV